MTPTTLFEKIWQAHEVVPERLLRPEHAHRHEEPVRLELRVARHDVESIEDVPEGGAVCSLRRR